MTEPNSESQPVGDIPKEKPVEEKTNDINVEIIRQAVSDAVEGTNFAKSVAVFSPVLGEFGGGVGSVVGPAAAFFLDMFSNSSAAGGKQLSFAASNDTTTSSVPTSKEIETEDVMS